MQYLLMIYSNEDEDSKRQGPEQAAYMKAYGTFTQDIIAKGQFKAGEALTPTSTATTVRVRDGKVLHTDGPFAETKEQLGGFYLVDCKDLDEAVAIAARIPTAAHGSIEVRPVVVWD